MAQPRRAALLVLSALTPLHPGAGRAPGGVDLPVVRDPVGLPHVRGSMLKGSLKSGAARLGGSLSNGSVDCGKAPDICCLLGGEVGQGPDGASAVAVLDLYPIAVPSPAYSLDGRAAVPGLVYVASAAALAAVASQAEAAGVKKLAGMLSEASRKAAEATGTGAGGAAFLGCRGQVRVVIASTPATLECHDALDIDREIGAGDLNPLYKSYPVGSGLVVLEDGVGRQVLEALMDRRTRVRLNRQTKTVESGGLWTEEYIPWGTLLAGLVVSTGFTNKFCSQCGSGCSDPLAKFREILESRLNSVIVIGGKESVGAGLAKAKLLGV